MAEPLEVVDVLVAAVVPAAGLTLGVLRGGEDIEWTRMYLKSLVIASGVEISE